VISLGDFLRTRLLGFENTLERIEQYLNSTKSNSKINSLRVRFRKSVLEKLRDNFSPERKFYVIEAPTGFGKTLTNLLVASYIQEKVYEERGFVPRIIYSLPFTSIVDQTYDVIRSVFGNDYNVVIFHHARSEISNGNGITSEDLENQGHLYLEMSRFWLSDIIVTTFEQIIYGLAWADKNYAFRYALIDGSIVILDEVQAIPLGLLDATRTFLETTKGTYYILSTATYPRLVPQPVRLYSMCDAYKHASDLGINLNNVEYVLDKFFDDMGKKTKYLELKDHVKEIINNEKERLIIVMNTIKSSVDVGRSVEELARTNGYEFYYLSSLVPPKVRRERIERLKRENRPFILVSTQVIEAGIDISSQALIRDFAPYDSIVQSAGRCNRNLEIDVGEVHIRALHDEKGILLAERIYDGSILNCTRIAIENLLKDVNGERIKRVVFETKLSEYYKKAVKRAKITDEIENLIRNLEFMGIQEKYKIIEEKEPKIPVVVIIDERSKNLVERALEIADMRHSIEKFKSLKEILRELAGYTINVPMYRDCMKVLEDYLRPIGKKESPYIYYVDAKGLLDIKCLYYDDTYGLIGGYLAEGAF